MAALSVIVTGVVTVGGLTRDHPGLAASATAAQLGEITTSAGPPEPAETRQLDVEAGMSTEVNAMGTRHTSAGAVVTNPNVQAAYGVEVAFHLKDATGATVDTATERVNYLPGRTSRIVAPLELGFGLAVEPTGVEVETNVTEFAPDTGPASGGDPFRRPEGARLEVVGPELVNEEYVSKVTGQIVNPTADVARFPSLHCVLRSEKGIAGGASTGLSDQVGAGGALAFDTLMTFAPDGVDDVDCEAHASP